MPVGHDEQLLAAPEAYKGTVVAPLATRFPIRALLNEILADERALLKERSQDASEQRRRMEWIRMIALGAQLLLLSLVLMALGRQVGRRLAAEKQTAQASQRALVVLDTIIPASDEQAGKISSFRGFLLLERQKHSEQGSLF